MCNPVCTPTNGTCDSNCKLTCSSGFADCNNNVADGCETPLNTTSNCGACGADCSCFDNAVCAAGKCRGVQRREGSACIPQAPCIVGVCQGSGECSCMDGQDMLAQTQQQSLPDMAHGHDKPGGCDVGGGGEATAWVLMAVGLAGLLRRRRRETRS